MRNRQKREPVLQIAACLVVGCLTTLGCDRYAAERESTSIPGPQDQAEHPHREGMSGGVIATVGRDEYHTEAVLESGGALALYTLGPDETRLHEVSQQVLSAYVQPEGQAESWVMVLRPDPLAGDSEAKTSRFRGELPPQAMGKDFRVTIPGLRIDGERFTVRFDSPRAAASEMVAPEMPQPRVGSELQALYLTAGGRYTEADIEANGRMTAAEKYAGFRASHDMHPQPGDRICPVTETKANPECRWIIGGQSYQFCCPPCIDEFLTRAKESPDEIREPAEYVQ